MTPADPRQKWERRQEEWTRLGVRVDGATVAAEILADLDAIARPDHEAALTLDEAAFESGYSAEHLRHLVADGKIRNAGRRGRPLIRRTDLPRKPGHERRSPYDVDADAVSLTARRLARG